MAMHAVIGGIKTEDPSLRGLNGQQEAMSFSTRAPCAAAALRRSARGLTHKDKLPPKKPPLQRSPSLKAHWSDLTPFLFALLHPLPRLHSTSSPPKHPKIPSPRTARHPMKIPHRHLVLGLLLLLAMITYVDRVCISVAGTTIQNDLQISPEQWGWILGAFALSYALFEVPSGMLGDRLGPRKTLTRIVLWWSAFTALTGMANGFSSLIATRFCFGAGEAGAFPNVSATLKRWFPAKERGGAQGWVWMATRLGAALSPVLVLPLQNGLGWRWTFVLFGAIGTVWAIAWYLWFRDNPRDKPGVSPEELAHIGVPPSDQNAAPHAPPWKELLSQPNLGWLMLMYFLYCWSAFFYFSWLHVFLEKARAFSKADLLAWSWLPFALGGLANLLGGLATDRLTRRIGLTWGRRWIGLLGLFFAALFTTATWATQDKACTLLFIALGCACSDLMLPVAWAACLDIGGPQAGAISGAMNMAGQLASFLSSVAFGYIVKYSGNNWNAPLLPMAVTALLGALCWLRIDAGKPLHHSQEKSPANASL
jgi:ACS family glucarate transporter-like MFS transporter